MTENVKHEIYCFNNGGSPNFLEAVAISDDGHVIASHLCSCEGWMSHDLGITSDWKHENYNKHFGEGNWVLVWVNHDDERLKKAIELNNQIEIKEGEQ